MMNDSIIFLLGSFATYCLPKFTNVSLEKNHKKIQNVVILLPWTYRLLSSESWENLIQSIQTQVIKRKKLCFSR